MPNPMTMHNSSGPHSKFRGSIHVGQWHQTLAFVQLFLATPCRAFQDSFTPYVPVALPRVTLSMHPFPSPLSLTWFWFRDTWVWSRGGGADELLLAAPTIMPFPSGVNRTHRRVCEWAHAMNGRALFCGDGGNGGGGGGLQLLVLLVKHPPTCLFQKRVRQCTETSSPW